jgi:hypothetical protein
MLCLAGVYADTTERPQRKPRLRRTRAPTSAQLTQLENSIAHRVCRHLTRKGCAKGCAKAKTNPDSVRQRG